MGILKPLEFYLSKIRYVKQVILLESFIGTNTRVSYKYPKCGCIINTNLKLLAKFKNIDKGIIYYVSCDFGGFPEKKWKFNFVGYTKIVYFYTDGSRKLSKESLLKRDKTNQKNN